MEPPTSMERLIPLINKILDVSRTVDLELDLPCIAVVGSQSAGKSSVLESFVGRDFLPRGAGLCTRRPLVLQLLHHAQREYAVFLHSPEEFEDFEAVRKEIVRVTDHGLKKNEISNVPINLKIYSPHVANLTLVDLPGLIQVAGKGQGKNLPSEIREMVHNYIKPESCLILAISAANSDLATSEGLQLAKIVDPQGERTIGVLTKLDLMDKGTDAKHTINNQDFPLKLGYVGVVNRSQKDIADKVNMRSARQHEKDFISQNYSEMANRMGTSFLESKLTELLQTHIYRSLPQLRKQIQIKLSEWSEKASVLEKYNSDPCHIMITLLKDFHTQLKEDIEGVGQLLSFEQLSEGTKIKDVIHTWFPQRLQELIVNDYELKTEIEIAIHNIYGIKTHLNSADAALKAVLAKEIDKLREPSYEAVDRISELINGAIEKDLKPLTEYQPLHNEVQDRMNGKVEVLSKEAKSRLDDYIEDHKHYINHKHEDFHITKQQKSSSSENKELWSGNLAIVGWQLMRNRTFWFVMSEDTLSWYKDATKRDCIYRLPLRDLSCLRLKKPFYSSRPQFGLQNKSGSNIYQKWKMLSLSTERDDDMEEFLRQIETHGGVKVTRDDDVPSWTGYIDESSEDQDDNSGAKSKKGEWKPRWPDSVKDVEAVHRYVQPYLQIVHKDQKDILPKIIANKYIHQLTNYAESELFALIRDVDTLMQESAAKKTYREETMNKVKALQDAKTAISEF